MFSEVLDNVHLEQRMIKTTTRTRINCKYTEGRKIACTNLTKRRVIMPTNAYSNEAYKNNAND